MKTAARLAMALAGMAGLVASAVAELNAILLLAGRDNDV